MKNRQDYIVLYKDQSNRIHCNACNLISLYRILKFLLPTEEAIITDCPIQAGTCVCLHFTIFEFNNKFCSLIATIDKCDAKELNLCTRECARCYWTLLHNHKNKIL